MILGLFKKRDPICGMKEEKGKGIREGSHWFCSESCKNKFQKKIGSMKELKECCH